jgi:hypothetical protein
MIRTTLRHIAAALAAATLVSVVATGPASAQGWDHGNRMRGSLFPPGQTGGATESPNGLAAKKHSQRSRLTPGSVQKEAVALGRPVATRVNLAVARSV